MIDYHPYLLASYRGILLKQEWKAKKMTKILICYYIKLNFLCAILLILTFFLSWFRQKLSKKGKRAWFCQSLNPSFPGSDKSYRKKVSVLDPAHLYILSFLVQTNAIEKRYVCSILSIFVSFLSWFRNEPIFSFNMILLILTSFLSWFRQMLSKKDKCAWSCQSLHPSFPRSETNPFSLSTWSCSSLHSSFPAKQSILPCINKRFKEVFSFVS